MPGTVKHGVASTAFCMKMANARVVTARKSPGMRNAGRPTRMATTAVTAPPYSMTTGSGSDVPRCTATSVPTATSPNWPSETWPAQPVSMVSDRATTE